MNGLVGCLAAACSLRSECGAAIDATETKNAAPLEKKPKKVNVDRVSYRQERVELSVVDFVQNLIVQDSDTHATDVIANIVEVSNLLSESCRKMLGLI